MSPFETVISDTNVSYDSDKLPGTAFGSFTTDEDLGGMNVAKLGQTIRDLHAKSVLKELVAADEAESRARRTMRDKVLKALPASKAIRYLQLEFKIRAAQDYDLATTIPLIRQ